MTLYPAATYRQVPNASGQMIQHRGLVLHVQAGDGSPFGWFSNPTSDASSTWWVGKDGTVEQYVDADRKAWAQGSGNADYNSVETEGQPEDPLTPEQVESLAHLYAWGHTTYAWPFTLAEKPGEPGFGWHGMGGDAWGGHIYCPGDKRKAQRLAILARAQQLTTGGDDMTPDECRQVVREELLAILPYALGYVEGEENSKFNLKGQPVNLHRLDAKVDALLAKMGVKLP